MFRFNGNGGKLSLQLHRTKLSKIFDKNFFEKQIKSNRIIKVISGLQVYGGITGLILVVIAGIFMFSTVFNNPVTILDILKIIIFVTVGFVLFLANFYSGYFLYKQKAGGIILSLGIQLLQIIQLRTDNIHYEFVSGFSFRVFYYNAWYGFKLNAGPRFFLGLEATGENNFVSINIIAVLVVIYLLMILNKTRSNNK